MLYKIIVTVDEYVLSIDDIKADIGKYHLRRLRVGITRKGRRVMKREEEKPEPTINDIKRQIEEDEECGGCGFYTSDPDSQPLENCETCGRESV